LAKDNKDQHGALQDGVHGGWLYVNNEEKSMEFKDITDRAGENLKEK
jgi:hypothetical protein